MAEQPPQGDPVRNSVETDDAERDEDAMDVDSPRTSPRKEEGRVAGTGGITKSDIEIMRGIVNQLASYQEDGLEIFHVFARIPNKRFMPHYYDVIKNPIAFSTIRAHILKKEYTSWKQYVADFAQIVHNCQVFNRPSSDLFKDAAKLRELFQLELAKLVQKEIITPEEAEFPDLGPLPEYEESPPPVPGETPEQDEQADDDDEPEEEEEEDEEEEDDISDDDDGPRKRRRKSGPGRPSLASRQEAKNDGDEAHKKRGRPPKVFTPMEARINTILKGLRKPKDENGDMMVLPFERMPDKTANPEYYQDVKKPIALDIIKRRAKRKNYNTVEALMKDVDLMFDNAKGYNLEDSIIYRNADALQKEARSLAEIEKAKPDSAYADEDGKIPLSEALHKGDVYKVGDWVHLQNPNDITKPIVSQIQKIWQEKDGQKWINACWYYRPEQTVHHYEKHFYEREVVKTGQYRDHRIEDIIDRCFVMFHTRFFKGRPRNFPADKDVYVCEARYNELHHKINKIKTWTSCLPAEVRDKDYEMDLFEYPRKPKKFPSPIKHLLRDDAKENDPIPIPTMGAENAPPIVGAVHKRPREANVSSLPNRAATQTGRGPCITNDVLTFAQESPPPEPTPPPKSPDQVQSMRRMTSSREARPSFDSPADVTMSGMSPAMTNRPTPSPRQSHTGLPGYGQQFASRVSNSPVPHLAAAYNRTPAVPATPAFPQQQPIQSAYGASYSAAGQTNVHSGTPAPILPNYNDIYRAPPATSSRYQSSNAYNPPKPSEVWMLPEVATEAIPRNIREQFQDAEGRVVWFDKPPLSRPKPTLKGGITGHSLKYLAKKAEDEKKLAAKRKAREEELEAEAEAKRRKTVEHNEEFDKQARTLLAKGVEKYLSENVENAEHLLRGMFGDDADKALQAQNERIQLARIETQKKHERAAELEKLWEERKYVKL